MAATVRRLGPGDEPVLAILAREDEDFDLDGRGEPHEPLEPGAAATFLVDPSVRAWVAEEEGRVVGFLYGHVLRKRAGAAVEILLYEIGVREAHRRRGVGRALIDALKDWAAEHDARETWVLADNPGALAFYRACDFEEAEESGTMLTHFRMV